MHGLSNAVNCFLILLLAAQPTAPVHANESFVYPLKDIKMPTADAAREAGRRQAIEQAVPDLLGPPQPTEKDTVTRKRLLLLAKSASEGFVTLSDEPAYHELIGSWSLRGVGRVKERVLRALLDRVRADFAKPQPRILVAVTATVEYTNWPWGPVPLAKDELKPLIGHQIEGVLAEYGFKVMDAGQIEKIKQRTSDFARLYRGDPSELLGIAHNQRADILVVGHAPVTGPRNSSAGAKTPLYMWETKPAVSAVRVDTAEKASVAMPDGEFEQSGSLFKGPAGARTALQRIGPVIGEQIVLDLLRQPGAEPRDVTILVLNASAKEANIIVKEIRGIQGVSCGEPDKIPEGLELRIKTKIGTFDLMETIKSKINEAAHGEFLLNADKNGANSIELSVTRSR